MRASIDVSTRKTPIVAPLKTVITERLQEIVIFELHENGDRGFFNLTLRDLYTHVIKCIRTGKTNEQIEKEQNQEQSFTEEASLKTRSRINTCDVPASFSSMMEGKNDSTDSKTPRKRATSVTFDAEPHTTYRERLGGYLHPRDMRRLITPFSSSNEPQLIVRRHAMLLNFDPLRTIILRDRLLVLVPAGADKILIEIENRVRGNIMEVNSMAPNFGDQSVTTTDEDTAPSGLRSIPSGAELSELDKIKGKPKVSLEKSDGEDDVEFCEWDEIDNMKWISVNFELLAVDGLLQTVLTLIKDEAESLADEAKREMAALRGGNSKTPTHLLQEHLRMLKDQITEMALRVNGFVRALNGVLDEDEDMALMNLSRLITHPERFIQPVSREVLEEESDEPELILEAYLQEALSIGNSLDFLKNQVLNTEEQVAMKMDSIRNQLLFINAILTIVTVCLTAASLVGSIFGMNLTNHLEDADHVFAKVVTGTLVGAFMLFISLWCYFQRTMSITSV